jgi:hypothetical protein
MRFCFLPATGNGEILESLFRLKQGLFLKLAAHYNAGCFRKKSYQQSAAHV